MKDEATLKASLLWGLVLAAAAGFLGLGTAVMSLLGWVPSVAGQAGVVVAGAAAFAVGYFRLALTKERKNLMTLGVMLMSLMAVTSLIGGGLNLGSLTAANSNTETACALSVTPILTVTGSDALAPGTATTGTYKVSQNGGIFSTLTSGTTTIAPGTNIDVLFTNNTGYHNQVFPGVTPCAGAMTIPVALYKNSSMTIRVFNTNSVAMTTGGASTGNQTVASGGSYNLPVKLDGTDKTSTQDMVLVAEASSTTVTDKILWNGREGSRAAPSSYTLGGASAGVWVFDVPAVTGANTVDNTLTVQSKTSQTLAGATVKLTFLTKEHAIDSLTGKLIYNVEDSAGTSLSIGKYIFTTVYT